MRTKARGPQKVAYELLAQHEHPASYDRLNDLIEAHHEELHEARIALAYCSSWRADVDGHQKLGQCKKASALDRELADYDFVVLVIQQRIPLRVVHRRALPKLPPQAGGWREVGRTRWQDATGVCVLLEVSRE
jgi:hypothetical protein